VTGLIANNINVAANKRTAPPVVEGWMTALARAEIPTPPVKPPVAKIKSPVAQKIASAAPLPPVPPPMPGSTDPIRPIPVKTIMVQPGIMHTASLAPLPAASRTLRPAPTTANPAAITTIATIKSEPPNLTTKPAPTPVANKVTSAPAKVPAKAATQELAAKPHGPWIIQVGAFDIEKDAKERLSIAKDKAKAQLGEASPFTEPVAKGAKTLYRARFAGLEKSQAEIACKYLKRSDIPCMMLKN
jgi:D-alanyl-D-alanine carboxypeptidase